jgi:hypothetical protein
MDDTGQLSNIGDFFARIVEKHDSVNIAIIAVLFIVMGLALWNSRVYYILKYPVTLVHEAGHGFVGMVAGHKIEGIRLHSDTSGLTTARGRRGFGSIMMSFWGYPAPSALGLLILFLVSQGYATASLWVLLLMLILVLVQIRNWFGVWSVLSSGIVVIVATQFLDPFFQGLIATAIAALLLLGAVRGVYNLQQVRKQTKAQGIKPTSDADNLSAETIIPPIIWIGLWYAATVGAVVLAWLFLLKII